MSHLGTGCLVAAFFLLAAGSGSLAFADLLGGAAAAGPWRGLLFVLFLVGFGVKAGVVPLHVWLPEAHPAAPSNVSALMSGGLVNAGLYGLVRVGAGGLGVPIPAGAWAFSSSGPCRRSWECSTRSARTTSSACWPSARSRTSASRSWGSAPG